MAGLACGEANTISWDILKNHSSFFASVPDWVTARGMRILSSPLGEDPRIISGESGAVPAGIAATLLQDEEYRDFRDALGLNADSVILVFSSEGDTDPDHYRSVVWDGEIPSGNV
jgi:diaminopropionate ammonia-lyase